MSTSPEAEQIDRLEGARALAEQEVKESLQSALEPELGSWVDHLIDEKVASVQEWMDSIAALPGDEFSASAVCWSQLIAVHNGERSIDLEECRAPLLTLAHLEEKFPFDKVDDDTGEGRAAQTVETQRIDHCVSVVQEQLSCLDNLGESLVAAAEAGNIPQTLAALASIKDTAAAMTRTHGLWMRHLEPNWPQRNSFGPEDTEAAREAFKAFRAAS